MVQQMKCNELVKKDSNVSDEEIKLTDETKSQNNKTVIEKNKQMCHGVNCSNYAIEHSDWEDEFCSSSCVIKTCKSVFADYFSDKK